jgi:hypothetical protein
MKKYNIKVYAPIVFSLTLIFGLLSIILSGWFFLGVIVSMVAFIHVQNRSNRIAHYCIGVDLDTNKQGDVIEISLYAFNSIKKQYYPLMTHFKQLRIYVNVISLDNFYSNIGYPIIEDEIYQVRKVKDLEFDNITEAKKFYRKMINTVNTSYAYSCGSMIATNVQQPIVINTKPGIAGKLWNWWTFKNN